MQKQLTQEQQKEIEKYAKWAGKKWKEQLRMDWMKSGSYYYPGEWCYLQQIRNQFGPSWLTKFKLETQ